MSNLDALHRACRLGDAKLLKQFIEEEPGLVNCIDQKLGWGPLYRTVICGHYDATMLLLEKGADPNIRNKLGETPLHQAADNSALRIAQLLLDWRADPNSTQHGD
jgi:ankyrin repeat protein